MSDKPAVVLVVEDEPDIRRIAELALVEVGGLVVQTCETGHQALEIAAEQQPELILLDVMMPGMDGVETLEALRANPRTQDIPVIFVSAKVQPREVANYLGRNVIGVIAKPFDPMTLAEDVCSLWRSRSVGIRPRSGA